MDRERLSFDICRCHDDSCDQHTTCRRWLGRNDGKSGDWITHAATLRQINHYDAKKRKICQSYLSVEGEASRA